MKLDHFKKSLRKLLSKRIRYFLWSAIPKIHKMNTYLISYPRLISDLYPINEKFEIKEIGWSDEMSLKKASDFRGPSAFRKRIPARLNSHDWVGLGIFDKTNGDIAYLAWIIIKSIRYLEEFGIHLNKNQFLLKDGFCVPKYRHQGLHTRMECERINYCVRKGAKEIYIQIHDDNEKGKESVINNGYNLINQKYIIQWPALNIYRSLNGFLRNPFLRIIK